jgi:glucose/arabinose dehydrogenase
MRFRTIVVAAVCAAVVLPASTVFAQLKATTYVSGLSAPVAFVQDPGDATIQYVVQQGGRIRLIKSGVLQSTDFLNIASSILSGGERGLLGMALPPDHATSGRFFVYFNDPNGDIVVARFKRSLSNPLIADTSTRFDMLWSTGERVIRHPDFGNHNGGNIAFGPDGYLYIGTGDGGSANDPNNNAQNPASLLGKMLRIDVSVLDSNTAGFAVPADNPFRTSSRPEIWDFGLRNPWRWSFDDPSRGGTGALVIGDVGQNAFEEIDYEPAGRGGQNYGWRNREGAHDNVLTTPPAFLPLVDPIYEYGRTVGQSITGGFVYRGSALPPTYQGRYFFADFVAGRLWSLALTINPSTGNATASNLIEHTSELAPSQVSSFGVDASGELYFVNYGAGRVSRIAPAGPTMSVDKPALAFGAVSTGGAFSSQTGTQPIRLTQSGAGTVTWTASSNVPWLVVSPTSGSGTGTLNASVQFVSGLGASQTGTITLAFTGAGLTPAPIQVTLNVAASGASASPLGVFETPLNGATGVVGSIAVTGWAVDDVEVSRIRILRDAVSGEPAGTLVFIGNAALVEGARPDVQATFPSLPRASRAGWGYLLLTNVLPGLGNGTFRLTAIADDVDGHSTTLGTKTITCANSTATRPFGAIDTPAQGGTVIGTMTNFGWVMSAGPRRADPPGGGQVQVVIDGAFTGVSPAGWASRSDLSALFPVAQFPGVNTALGVAVFDSTALANGVHTISWVVTDDVGSASGIGSRFFTVSNGSGLTMDPDSFRLKAEATGGGEASSWLPPSGGSITRGDSWLPPSGGSITREDSWLPPSGGSITRGDSWLPPSGGSITGRRGFDPATPYRTYEADADGRVTIQAEQLDRIELHVGAGAHGYQRLGGALQPLPIGSHLDPDTGTFTWNPGVGFLGTYDLVLGGRDVRIVLNPQAGNRPGIQVVIDVPLPPKGGSHEITNHEITNRDPILVAGWAADLRATGSTGVDAVHVWAYPIDGGAPIFVGAAEYGGARPDVAAVHGQRFLKTGYGLMVKGLAAGTYDLAVFAYSTVRGGFAPATLVRVVVR